MTQQQGVGQRPFLLVGLVAQATVVFSHSSRCRKIFLTIELSFLKNHYKYNHLFLIFLIFQVLMTLHNVKPYHFKDCCVVMY